MVDGAAAICGEARHVALRRETELEVAVDDLGLATEELIFGLVCYGRPMSLELALRVGKTVMSAPISARMTSAVRFPTPGMMSRRSRAALCAAGPA